MNSVDMVTYEQPLTEIIRVCLRLERLFLESDRHANDTTPAGTHHLVVTILNLLQLLERPDFKSKMARELAHHMQALSRLEKAEGVDQSKLQALLEQLENLSQLFINSSTKIGQILRQTELLNHLRLHLAAPGGGCSFDTPLYYYWLQLPSAERMATLHAWLAEFDNVRLASHLILKLLRTESHLQNRSAVKGFHQELLDAQGNLRLIRVMLPKQTQAFPEISLNRHFMSIRFLTPTIQTRPLQLQEDLSFLLGYCTA